MNTSDPDKGPIHIGRYRIESLLGRGGMAVVYLAFDPYMERQVAIKVLLKNRSYDDGLRSRFKRESRMVASLNHPAIVPVYDFGEEDDQPYLVMRYMEGGSLRERLRRAPLGLTEVASILNHIAPALDTTHAHNIIHRDLKPSNILFDSHNNAYLADFGLAKFAEGTYTTLTRNDGMVGTPAYMSPEQIRGQSHLDGRSDVYALGVILFEVLAGQLPFKADGRLPIALMHLSDPVPQIHTINPALPKSVSPIIARAMAKNREERFVTASALTAPFVKAARLDTLPVVEFPHAPPIVLQPKSESGSSWTGSVIPTGENHSQEPPPNWLQSWLASCGTKQDIGRSRTQGTLEDRLRVSAVQTQGGLTLLLAAISDGSSSQQHGHLAAELTINELFNQVSQSQTAVPEEIPAMLQQALEQTNRTLYTVARKHREPLVMQSTVVLAAIHENRLYTAHVGNGRIFLVRNRRLRQLTRGLPPPDLTASSRTNGHFTDHVSAIGCQPDLQVDLGLFLKRSDDPTTARQNQGLLMQINDRLLLCSDGLIAQNGRRRQHRRLRRVLSEHPPAEAANLLVRDALTRNVQANVTAVVLQAPGTVPHVPRYRRGPYQFAATTLAAALLVFALLSLPERSQPTGVFFPPGTATQIAQIIRDITATAESNLNRPAAVAATPLIAPDTVPDPGFAVIFAAGEGAMIRQNRDADWQAARAGDQIFIGGNTAIQSGNDRLGVVLSDGAELYLAPQAELAIHEVNQPEDQAKATRVSMAYGRLFVHYKNADPHSFNLETAADASLTLTTGNNIAGIIYDAQTGILEVDCFMGSCRLGNGRRSRLVPPGRFGLVDGLNISSPSAARSDFYCDLAPTLLPCPVATTEPSQTVPPVVQTVIAATETTSAQTAVPTASIPPSATPLPPQPTLTPVPTNITNPGPSSTPQPPTSTPNSPSATPSPAITPDPTPTRTTPPTATNSPVPSSTPAPSRTPSPQPTATATLRFTPNPISTATPTADPGA